MNHADMVIHVIISGNKITIFYRMSKHIIIFFLKNQKSIEMIIYLKKKKERNIKKMKIITNYMIIFHLNLNLQIHKLYFAI